VFSGFQDFAFRRKSKGTLNVQKNKTLPGIKKELEEKQFVKLEVAIFYFYFVPKTLHKTREIEENILNEGIA